MTMTPPNYRQFMKQKNLLAKIPWGGVSLALGAVILFSTTMYLYSQQNYLYEAIKAGELPDGFIEMKAAELVVVMRAALGGAIVLLLGGIFLEGYLDKRNQQSYLEILRRYDTNTLVKVARSEEMGTMARSLSITELNRRAPGWSMA